jgi:hypothetical protein
MFLLMFADVGSRHVFVDESGDPDISIEKQGVSEYFVLTAVIVDSSDLESEEGKARGIIDRFFPKGEIKSSRIGGNIPRRLEILRAVSGLEFKHYSQVIDKSLILADSGLRFRRSFVKFINRILYRNLFRAFSDLHVIADEHGKSDFMLGFSDYLQRRIPQRLFERSTFQFANSKEYPFIQVADLIAGTILRCYTGQDPHSSLDPVRQNTIMIDEWPPRFPEPLGLEELSELDKYSYLVRRHALQQANDFIDERSLSTDPYDQAQVAAVRYLLYHFRSIDPEDYIPTAMLHKHLSDLGFVMSERVLRQRVIAKLRDEGVFIASTRKGIKIPYSVSDLRDFVSTVNNQVVPYLKRLELCRKHFLLATNGGLDIVGKEEFPRLARFLSADV